MLREAIRLSLLESSQSEPEAQVNSPIQCEPGARRDPLNDDVQAVDASIHFHPHLLERHSESNLSASSEEPSYHDASQSMISDTKSHHPSSPASS